MMSKRTAGRFSRSLLLLCLLHWSAALQAQNRSADSIRSELAHLDPKNPHYLERKAGALGTLLQVVKYSNPEEALKISDTLGAVFMQAGDSAKGYEALYRYKATVYDLKGEYDKMLLNLEAYAEALSHIGKSDGYVYIDIGNVYYSFTMLDLAQENYRYAEEIFTRENNLQGLCTIYNNYAQIQIVRQKPDSALPWLRKSYDIRFNKLKDRFLADDSRIIMAKVYRDKGQLDSAKALLLGILADTKDPALDRHTDHIALRQEFTGVYTSLGTLYAAEKNPDSAVYYFRAGEKIYKESGYRNRLPALYTAWAKLQLDRNQPDSALFYLHRLEEVTDDQNPYQRVQLYDVYADYYEKIGNKLEAYRNRMEMYRINDSLQTSGQKDQVLVAGSRVIQLENKARIEQQKAELAQKNAEAQRNQRQRTSLLALSGALLLLVLLAIFSVYQLRKKNAIINTTNRELEAANATKEQFLSIISHDLRSPFNTLIGMSNVLVSNVREKNYTQVSDNAELINESSRKAYVLLDNLMQWVSLQKENINVSKEPLMVNEVVEEVLRLFRGQALAQSITIAKDIRATQINTDKNLLQVILRNLLSNAIRHIPVGGKVQLQISGSGKDVCIIVEDNGKGFTDEVLQQLFRKGDGTSIARKGGGLGLLLVEQFVRQLDGTITAGNVPSGGARFTILLHGAMLAGSEGVAQATEREKRNGLSEEEKRSLAPLLVELKKYEIFDTSEVRALLEQKTAGEPAAIAEWRKQLLQALYHADEQKYRTLIDSATTP